MNNQEIERKFLVTDAQKIIAASTTHYEIIQGYICRLPGRTVRIRHCAKSMGEQTACMTIKAAPKHADSFTRFEWEKAITTEDFRALLPLCDGAPIIKTRYIIPATTCNQAGKELKWEVDIFHGKWEGLIMAEIELPAEDTPFDHPSWLGEEVTHDPRYYNANMR